jgi:DNA-binding NtrC family response regulator
VLQVTLPPLRDRPEDIPLLVDHLLARLDPTGANAAPVRDPAHLETLAAHAWPGNVRELRNYLERCVALGEQSPPGAEAVAGTVPRLEADQPLRVARERWVAHFERRYLEALLREHGGNVSAAARAAGVDRVHFYRLMSRHGVRR